MDKQAKQDKGARIAFEAYCAAHPIECDPSASLQDADDAAAQGSCVHADDLYYAIALASATLRVRAANELK